MRDVGKKLCGDAVEDLLCRLKNDHPDLADSAEDEPADGQRLRRRPDPSYEEWKKIATGPSAGE
jgi:hypothetical protein